MRSLFLVSLPRSLSSLLYQRLRDTLQLAEPSWTSDGEVLNLHRHALMPEAGSVEGVRFLRRDADTARFDRLLAFLDRVVEPDGSIYKDVVHPFVVAHWLPASEVRALRLDRPLADVAWSMLERGWHYPRAAADPEGTDGDPERQLLTGLARGRRVLASLAAPVLAYDELIESEAPLATALEKLYGDGVPCPAYLDDDFRAVRDANLARRDTARSRRLAELARRIEDEETAAFTVAGATSAPAR
ncbi:MAG TPA: hypothetical protein VGE98_08490 [Thermoanaerobaculia bacterium]